MAPIKEVDDQLEDDYNEDADSDFDGASNEGSESTVSSEEEGEDENSKKPGSRKPYKPSQNLKQSSQQDLGELDSGDEATIKEQKKTLRKQKRKGELVDDDVENEMDGWRARTRAMREREKNEIRLHKLASTKQSTIDVDKVWEEMNRPKQLEAPRIESESVIDGKQDEMQAPKSEFHEPFGHVDKENVPTPQPEDMITIKRTYKFAGQIHTEEKVVPKSSAEARLYLAQQSSKPQATIDGRIIQRPLRKISRFDPNYNNMEAFRSKWTTDAVGRNVPTGPKLNVVEKSKMDWAVHVDAEGLKEELDEHAKAKEGYLNRMDFLTEVEQRREAEARAARLKVK